MLAMKANLTRTVTADNGPAITSPYCSRQSDRGFGFIGNSRSIMRRASQSSFAPEELRKTPVTVNWSGGPPEAPRAAKCGRGTSVQHSLRRQSQDCEILRNRRPVCARLSAQSANSLGSMGQGGELPALDRHRANDDQHQTNDRTTQARSYKTLWMMWRRFVV